jgi:ABC-type glycerol-3-phosphate transport system substrate-binding protein
LGNLPPASSSIGANSVGSRLGSFGGGPTSPAGAGNPPPTQPPQAAQTPFRQSPFKFLPFIVAGVILVVLFLVVLSKIFNRGGSKAPSTLGTTPGTVKNVAGQTTLEYWGLWEPSAVFSEVLADFEKQNPSIKVNYKQETYRDYRDRLQNAIVTGKGPDIFRFHASWVPMLSNELAPMPDSVMTPAQFQQTFYPVATQQLSLNGKPVAMPLEYDGLALFYNDEALKTANLPPPQTWRDLQAAARQLTIRTGSKISRAGAALGLTGNVEHFSDILGLLILQNGGDPANPTSQQAVDALDFYTRFATVDKVWDASLPSSTVAFARGDVAMMLAPSWRIHDIKALNPNLKFSVAPVPQLTNKKVAWATYWAEGVSNQSKHQKEAWALLQYLSSPAALQKLYSTASKQRTFGEIYPRQDLASSIATDPLVAPFLADAPYASNWYMNSYTHDNGLNDQVIKYYEDAVNAITTNGQEVRSVTQTVQQGLAQVLRTYGLSSLLPTNTGVTPITP